MSKRRLSLIAFSVTVIAGANLSLMSTEAQGSYATQQAAKAAIADYARQISAAFKDYNVSESLDRFGRCNLVLYKSSFASPSYTINVWETKTARAEGSMVKVVCLDTECIRQHSSVTYPSLSIKSFAVHSAAEAEQIAPLIDQMRMQCAIVRQG